MFSILVQHATQGENGDSLHERDSTACGLTGKLSIAWSSVCAEEQFAGLVVWYEQKKASLASQMKKVRQLLNLLVIHLYSPICTNC